MTFLLTDGLETDASLHNSAEPTHRSHHVFQHQSSVVSTASVQTVLHMQHHQHAAASTTTNGSLQESISSASFHSVQTTGGGGGVVVVPSSAQSQNNYTNPAASNHYQQQRSSANGAAFYASATHPDDSSNSSSSNGGSAVLRIGDVADLLHPQYAIITGGRARDGSALITFPDHCNFHLLADADYANLIMYLTSVPS